MKGLSLWQPWASLVAAGEKRVETRSWTTDYRGPLAVLATKRLPAEALTAMDEPEFREALGRAGHPVRQPYPEATAIHLPRGCVVAVVTLADVVAVDSLFGGVNVGGAHQLRQAMLARGWDLGEHEVALGDYSPGRFAFRLTNIVAVKQPIACKGRQGLWTLAPDLVARLEQAV